MRPGHHRLAGAAGVDRDHRPSGGLRLDGRDPELLDVRHHQRGGRRRTGAPAASSPTRPRNSASAAVARPQALELGPRADDLDRPPGRDRRLDRDARAACGAPARRRTARGRRARRCGSARRRRAGARSSASRPQKRRIRSRVMLAVGDVAVDRCAAARRSKARWRRSSSVSAGPQRPRHLGQRARLLVPGVAEGRVAVADVLGPGGRAHAVGEGAAARHDAVEAAQVEPPRGGRVSTGSSARKLRLASAEALQRRGGHARPAKRPSVPASS